MSSMFECLILRQDLSINRARRIAAISSPVTLVEDSTSSISPDIGRYSARRSSHRSTEPRRWRCRPTCRQ